LRIIAGQWRGRRVPIPEAPGLRPSGDRIRETLFNWLAADLPGARCLDLFAGSGALGLEALSRGAAHCDFVDNNPRVTAALEDVIKTLGASSRAAVHRCGFSDFLDGGPATCDIVFLDPPFAEDCLTDVCRQVAASGILAPRAQVYLEYAQAQSVALPPGWDIRRARRAGAVQFNLCDTGQG
jgi:16S rRNA (guanine966-N2)-methyltransferase